MKLIDVSKIYSSLQVHVFLELIVNMRNRSRQNALDEHSTLSSYKNLEKINTDFSSKVIRTYLF